MKKIKVFYSYDLTENEIQHRIDKWIEESNPNDIISISSSNARDNSSNKNTLISILYDDGKVNDIKI